MLRAAPQTPTEATWYRGSADAVRRNLPVILEDYRGALLPDDLLILSGQALYRMVRTRLIWQPAAPAARVRMCCPASQTLPAARVLRCAPRQSGQHPLARAMLRLGACLVWCEYIKQAGGCQGGCMPAGAAWYKDRGTSGPPIDMHPERGACVLQDYGDLLRTHRENAADITIATHSVGWKQASLRGIIRVDAATGAPHDTRALRMPPWNVQNWAHEACIRAACCSLRMAHMEGGRQARACLQTAWIPDNAQSTPCMVQCGMSTCQFTATGRARVHAAWHLGWRTDGSGRRACRPGG